MIPRSVLLLLLVTAAEGRWRAPLTLRVAFYWTWDFSEASKSSDLGLCLSQVRRICGLGDLSRSTFYPTFVEADRLPAEFAVRKALEEVRADGLLPPQLGLEVWVERGCRDGELTRSLAELRLLRNVSAVLGAPCSSGAASMGQLAAAWDVPVVSSGAKAADLADKALFPTFARVAETSSTMGEALLELVQEMGWRSVGLVGDPPYPNVLDSIRNVFQPPAVRIGIEEHVDSDALDPAQMDLALAQLRKASRVIVLALDRVGPFAEAALEATAAFLARAEAQGMTGPDYVYLIPLGIGGFTGEERLDSPRIGRYTVLKGDHGQLKPSTLRQVLVQQRTGRSAETIVPFLQRFSNWTLEPGAHSLVPNIREIYERRDWSYMIAMQSYDAAYLFGLAVGKCWRDWRCDPRSGRDLMAKARLSEFPGATGRVIMTGDFDREVGYRIYGLDPKTRLQTQYFEQELYLANRTVVKNGTNETEQYPGRRFVVLKDFPWATADGKRPRSRPVCGFLGERCTQNSAFPLDTVLAVAAALLLLLALVVFRRRQVALEKALLAKSWEIRFEELRMLGREVNLSAMDLGSVHTLGSKAHSLASRVGPAEDGGELVGFIGQAQLANRPVAVRQYTTTEDFQLSQRSELLQLKRLKDLDHGNLTGFVGLCLNRKGSLLVVWEACRKGSLTDILANSEIRLDATFRASIIRDVVMGLDFLHHSAAGVHGELSAEKCVVDSRWRVKLTDYGVGNVLRDHRLRGTVSSKSPTAEKLLHVAPEALRSWSAQFGVSAAPTKAADVYALAMVIYQVLTRRPLYDEERLSSDELIPNLTGGKMADYRPPVPPKLDEDHQGEASAVLVPLMLKCWSGDPVARPKMSRIRKLVASLSASQRNLVEHMMWVMEKCAGNLEQMVATRTAQVQEERQRAEELLARMLPASVASELKAGRPVHPETFHSTTIYFSDIVGFTDISSRLEPLQVVQLLNHIYLTFDEIIDKYDAYKVETIGDGYMVVSGLPTRNDNAHAAELGRMALEVRDAVADMRVPDLAEERLEVRIGLHTGPCVAGVIGNTMPRYCLFGDTVNTASRMQSSGEAMRVHVSEAFQRLLKRTAPDAFALDFRASIAVKGKGQLPTYWLDHPKLKLFV